MQRRQALLSLLTLSSAPAWALYDPQPDASLASVQGEWQGVLTYRDYSNPDKFVKLACKLFIALSAPNELVLHYVFADGPNKTVYSYEKMKFDFAGKQLSWHSGGEEKATKLHNIVSNTVSDGKRELHFEREEAQQRARYKMLLSAKILSFGKEEVSATGEAILRNRYEFTRV